MSAADYLSGTIRNDAAWQRQVFMVPGRVQFEHEIRARTFSPAELAFTDTTPGGSFGINPKYQFTEYCDPPLPGFAPEGATGGKGGYYHEAIDQSAELVYFQFGTLEHNSLTGFVSRYYDPTEAKLANTGDASGFFFSAGKAAGFILTLPLQVLFGAAQLVSKFISFITNTPRSKFSYLKPTQPMYWSAASNILNMISVRTGITEGVSTENVDNTDAKELAKENKKERGISYGNGLSTEEAGILHTLLPSVMRANGGLDIFAIATRAQRLGMRQREILSQLAEAATKPGGKSFNDLVLEYLDRKLDPPPLSKYLTTGNMTDPVLIRYMNNFYKKGGVGSGIGVSDGKVAVNDNMASQDYLRSTPVNPVQKWDNDPKYLKSELEDGAAWVGFYVDYTGSTSESMSNSTKTSDLENKMNSNAASVRSKSFDFANGNLGDGAVVNLMESVVGAAKDFVTGTLTSFGVGGLAGLGGKSHADINDFWDSCSATLPEMNYTMTLGGPYGNKLSNLIDVALPMSLILPMGLPLSTGPQSYTSPLYCRVHHKSHANAKLAILESMSFERGTGNVGWSEDDLALEVKVSLKFKNLDKVMHMPISANSGPTNAFSLSSFDEDSALTDYMSILSGQSLYDQYYLAPRLRLAWRETMAAFETWTSPARRANWFAGTEFGKKLSFVFAGGLRPN